MYPIMVILKNLVSVPAEISGHRYKQSMQRRQFPTLDEVIKEFP
jgi:hypothetical protein